MIILLVLSVTVSEDYEAFVRAEVYIIFLYEFNEYFLPKLVFTNDFNSSLINRFLTRSLYPFRHSLLPENQKKISYLIEFSYPFDTRTEVENNR